MPWYQPAKKDVTSCEKLRGVAYGLDPEMSEWGNPVRVMSHHPSPFCRAYRKVELQKGEGGARGELKHLSTRRKRNQKRFRK